MMGHFGYKKQFLISELNDREIMLYDILRLHGEMESAKLFLEFGKRISIKVTDWTYRNYMKHLCELGLVEEKGVKRWKRFGVV